MEKTVNHKAWFLVLPVLLLVAFSAVVPLMTVVNYSVQDTFGNNEFFWEGIGWFEEMLGSDRLWSAFWRQILFSAIILAIEVPLGIFIALDLAALPACSSATRWPSTSRRSSSAIRSRHSHASPMPGAASSRCP